MQYTFAQACKKLAGVTHGMAGYDVKERINDAIQGLAGLSGWECLRRVLRFTSVGPCFTLPQGSAGLVRLCVNGRPATLRASDFRFIHSGPGDLRHPPAGFRPVDVMSVLDNGPKPIIIEPQRPFRLFAFSDGANQPYITVRGVDPSGRDITRQIPMVENPQYDQNGVLTSGYEPDTAPIEVEDVYQTVTGVVLDSCATEYVTLFAEDTDTGERMPIALYNPYVTVPTFRQYLIPGVAPDQCVELLAEVRLDPLPLVRDTDIVPFDTLEPIEWMMRSNWCMQSAEVDQAQKYQDRAARWLQARQVTDDQVQTSVIINNAFANSLGEASMEAFNI